MSLIGNRLTLHIGSAVPLPAPPLLTRNLESVQVTQTDEGRSGFQISFLSGRSGPQDLLDDPLVSSPLLQAFNRVILTVTFNVRSRVLMDGIITHQELSSGDAPGTTRVTVTGEDVSVMMDMKDQSAEHPAQPDSAIVTKLIQRYAHYGLVPEVVPPKVIDLPNPIERVPVQQCTDLGYIEELARRNGHVFYVSPGPKRGVNRAYWGPPKRIGVPQKALSVNFGSETNVDSITFDLDALAPELVEGAIQDHRTNRKFQVRTFASLRVPLSAKPHWLVNRRNLRVSRFREVTPGLISASGRAQSQTDRSTDPTLTATGKLDAVRYGDVLEARGTVGVRGAGWSYDGLYYVKKVTHSLRQNEYNQEFTLTRDGLGSLTSAVRP
ncbi:MAG TPA: hypothetical protein VF173_13230 [Thermoanaerobaculia bacterium]|nr:hypothetical protein [Thermoanaerobaculia bacterium]